jgi:hypothetical protein
VTQQKNYSKKAEAQKKGEEVERNCNKTTTKNIKLKRELHLFLDELLLWRRLRCLINKYQSKKLNALNI